MYEVRVATEHDLQEDILLMDDDGRIVDDVCSLPPSHAKPSLAW